MTFSKDCYDRMGSEYQSTLDRFRYRFGLLPRVGHTARSGASRLEQKARLVISADLELGWAWRYERSAADPLVQARQAARQTRSNLPLMLELFDRYQTPVTWATVGHLFLDHCRRSGGKAHPNLPRPDYFENEFWRYTTGDWYDCDPCSSLEQAPEWYAPDLIRAILAAQVKHEIACHTFSHIDCSDQHCPPGLLEAELAECKRLAHAWGIELRSFVFPGHLEGNHASLKKAGFSSYRCHSRYQLGLPEQDEHGLWRIPGGIGWEKPTHWPVEAWINALKRSVDRALETKTVLHLWFHPSCDPINTERVIPMVLEYIHQFQTDLIVATMSGLAASLTTEAQV
jgi:hypothetical protein